MGNCVARDMGFDTDNIEKNKELLRKMQEVRKTSKTFLNDHKLENKPQKNHVKTGRLRN